MTDLVAHLESYLGTIAGGSRGDGMTPPGVGVSWFGPDVPFTGATTLVTLGLSHHHLGRPDGTGVHQELVLHLSADDLLGRAAGLLFQVAGDLVAAGRGLLRHQVYGQGRGRLFDRGELSACYAAAPVYLPDGFGVCDTGAYEVELTWLVPVTDAEVALVASRGWRALEDAFVAEDPDLTDVLRGPVRAALAS